MTYRSDLYRFDKIIGYTGKLHLLPTVYFRCDQRGIYGRITQQHKLPFNVGRGRPESTRGYEMRNEIVNGRPVLKEYRNGRCVHTSRNPFIPLNTGQDAHMTNGVNEATLGILAQAIRRFPGGKISVNYNQYDMLDAHCAIAQKHNMLNELRDHIHLIGDMRPSMVKAGVDFIENFPMNNAIYDAQQAALAKRNLI